MNFERLKWLLIFLLVSGGICFAQTSVVSGTIVDPASNVWSEVQIQASFTPAPGIQGPYTWAGGTFNQTPAPVIGNSSGIVSITLPRNDAIVPSGSTWTISVCPNATQSCAVINISLNASTTDLEAAINNAVAWPVGKISATYMSKVYNVNQFGTLPVNQGAIAYNSTALVPEYFNGTSWQTFGGGNGNVLSGNEALVSGYQSTGTTVGPSLQSQNLVAYNFNSITNTDLFQTGGGNNGEDNAVTAGLQNLIVPATSTSTEYPTGFAPTGVTPLLGDTGTVVHDYRNGSDYAVYSNPCSFGALTYNNTDCTDHSESVYYNKPPVGTPAEPSYYAHDTTASFMAYGNNTFPQTGEPAFKTNYGLESWQAYYYTPGQGNNGGITVHDYHFGDGILGFTEMNTDNSGGCGDNADECKHFAGKVLTEGNNASYFTCTSGCTTGSTLISASIAGDMTSGDLAYIYDPSAFIPSTIAGCTLATGNSQGGPAPFVTLLGNNCLPVSTMMLTTTGYQCNTGPYSYPVGACGPTVVTLATTSLPAGFTSSLSGLSASGTVYAVDDFGGGSNQLDDEATTYSISGGQLTVNFTQPHVTSVILSFGGAAGGLFVANANASVDDGSNLRVFQGVPILGVIGTTNPTVYFTSKSATVPVLDSVNNIVSESRVYQVSSTTTSVVSNGTIVTVGFTSPVITPAIPIIATYQGQTVVLSGLTPSSLNGNCTNAQMIGTNSFTCSKVSTATTATGQGTAIAGSLGYQWTNAAQIQHVMNLTTGNIDGTGMTIFPSNGFAFTTGQVLRAMHHPHMSLAGDQGFVQIGQYQPFLNNFGNYGGGGLGVRAVESSGAHLSGFQVDFTGVNSSNYLGYGENCPLNTTNTCGTEELPLSAYSAFGYYQSTFDVQAGESSLIHVHANNHGTAGYNTPYNLFLIDSNGGSSALRYVPQAQLMEFNFFNTHTMAIGWIPFTEYDAISFTPPNETGLMTAANITGMYGATPNSDPSPDPNLYVAVADSTAALDFQWNGVTSATATNTLWTVPALLTKMYTVSTLPTASSLAVGSSVLVSDSLNYTPGVCTSGGTDIMIAITDGVSTWSCH